MKKTEITNPEENKENADKAKKKNELKKQLVSGGVYIALAVTVVAVTVSTITATFSGLSHCTVRQSRIYPRKRIRVRPINKSPEKIFWQAT